jgi:putative PEP-CTERM system histidine kinase
MLIPLFYTLNVLLLLSGIASIRLKSGERNFSIALLRNLSGLPLLAGEYIYLAYHFEAQAAQLVLFSEIIFALLWLCLALRLHNIADTKTNNSHRHCLIEIPIAAAATYFLAYGSTHISSSGLSFSNYSPEYFSAIFILTTVLYTSWRLEQFWRGLNTAQRWEYKAMVVGSLFISGALLWSASYRLTYLSIPPKHFLLLAALLLSGWILMLYGVVSHRLLNRKIFISRKVVYSFVVPSILAAYLLGFGLISLVMNTFGLQLSYVLKWLFLILGCVAIGLFSFSGKIRRRIHFFISTHFYINKYEYRDEWLALSQELQGALTEIDVVMALRQVLSESLYTAEIFVWLGDSSRGYTLVSAPDISDINNDANKIAANDPLIYFILAHSHFHLDDTEPVPAWQNIVNEKSDLLSSLNLTLLSPISVGRHLIGLIGLGPEFTDGQYGHDDFDLLTVLGSQTASALMAVRMAEELAHAREQQAWNHLSAFVLHDIKNAATMLSLVKENAPEHIHEPEFQQDMLELMDDALKRMGRVEKRLLTLKDEIKPNLQHLELNQFLQTCCQRLEVKLPALKIDLEYSDDIPVHTDPELLFSILENLLLNAFEAQREETIVKIRTGKKSDSSEGFVEIIDNGPGIAEELLPDILFEPFKTNKKGGSGIGLWQAKRVLNSLNGTISADNNPQGGALFLIKLPLDSGAG